MISEQAASEQLLRMRRLDFFPGGEQDKSYLRELRLAIQAADTEEIAERVITDWLARSPECPKPADLRIACHAENDRLKPGEPAPGPRDQWNPVAKLGKSPSDKRFMDLYVARQRELADNPVLAKWHKAPDGSSYRTPTELSERLRTGAW